MKKIIIAVVLALCVYTSPARPVRVMHDVPARYIYRTLDSHGTVEFWQHKPQLYTDNNEFVPTWHGEGERLVVRNCVQNKHWRHSLRRIR